MKNKLFYILKLILLSTLLFACSEETSTPEEEIKQYIENVKLAAENRNHGDMTDLIHKNYRDQNGMNNKRIVKILRGYFLTHKDIHLFTKIKSINIQEKNKAFVIVNVAMAGNTIIDASSLSKLRAKIYRFELQLIKDDEWLLQQAKWHEANIKDFL